MPTSKFFSNTVSPWFVFEIFIMNIYTFFAFPKLVTHSKRIPILNKKKLS